MLAHEKLAAYEAYLQFAVLSSRVVDSSETWHAFADHLDRATESIGANLIRSNIGSGTALSASYLDIAVGSLYECVACLDLANAKELLASAQLESGRILLWRIRGMLIGLNSRNKREVRESQADYGCPQFPHDRLDVYNTGIDLARWIHRLQKEIALPIRRRNRLDVAATGLVLNIAESCGRTGKADKGKFVSIAYFHALQAALTLDLMVACGSLGVDRIEEGKKFVDRIAGMLWSWNRTLSEE